MVNLGVDFGSTYTMVSVLDGGEPKTVQPNGLSYSYPSIVAYDTNRKKYYFGDTARNKLGKRGVIGFRGFKMLLNHQMDQAYLSERGYDEKNTPEVITEMFLRHVIETTLLNLGEDRVDTLVLGAPECWFQSIETVDARGTLRDICCRMKDKVNKTRIISEPTNAAAFCVWCYAKSEGREFSGDILVVDYGGGTLDTALVSVRRINGKLQIKPESRSGRGENQEQEIGKAGIAYQEAVIKKAICDQLKILPEDIEYGLDFDGAVKSFEEALIHDSEDVAETFHDFGATPADLVNEIFTSIDYQGKSIDINFFQMKAAYCETIQPILKTVLDETTAGISKDRQIYLALVGGFCKFYLVKEQVNDYFHNGSLIAHSKNIIRTEENREKAIAHGAVLFSENIIDLCDVAPIGIGMYAVYNETGEIFKQYAINFMQEYIPGKIYFATDEYGEIAPMMLTKLDKFLLNFSVNKDTGFPMHPKSEFAEQLNHINHSPIVAVGFSIDNAERISVHVFNYNIDPTNRGPEDEPIESILLSTYKESFENATIQ